MNFQMKNLLGIDLCFDHSLYMRAKSPDIVPTILYLVWYLFYKKNLKRQNPCLKYTCMSPCFPVMTEDLTVQYLTVYRCILSTWKKRFVLPCFCSYWFPSKARGRGILFNCVVLTAKISTLNSTVFCDAFINIILNRWKISRTSSVFIYSAPEIIYMFVVRVEEEAVKVSQGARQT